MGVDFGVPKGFHAQAAMTVERQFAAMLVEARRLRADLHDSLLNADRLCDDIRALRERIEGQQ